MHRIILAAALSLMSACALAEITCDKPEYLQLKTADKAELQQEFCRSVRTHALNMKLHESTQVSISELRAMGADVTKYVEQGQQDLKAALSCSKAYSEYAGALERRFKMKPPAVKVCLSPGPGI